MYGVKHHASNSTSVLSMAERPSLQSRELGGSARTQYLNVCTHQACTIIARVWLQDAVNASIPYWPGSNHFPVPGRAGVLANPASLLDLPGVLHNAQADSAHDQVQVQPLRGWQGVLPVLNVLALSFAVQSEHVSVWSLVEGRFCLLSALHIMPKGSLVALLS
jgi:hypothetical protein